MSKEKLLKYWILLFFLANICSQYTALGPISGVMFYSMLALGIAVLFLQSDVLYNKVTVKRFPIVYWYALILVAYQFTFGLLFVSDKTWTYLISKILVDFAIVVSLTRSAAYYEKDFFPIVAKLITVLLVFGYLFNNTVHSGRQTLGFGNPNALGSISAMCFGVTLILKSKKPKVQYIIMGICLLGVLLSGSRASMGIIVISILLKYGLNYRLIGVGCIILVIVLWVLPAFDIQFTALTRFTEAVENKDISSGRETEREATMLMIRQSPWIGNGIYSGQSEEASKISQLGSHNGYLDYLKWFGYPLGLFWIGLLLFYAVRLFLRFRNTKSDEIRAHLFVVIATLLAANFEAYIWGVNQMITTLFFVSISFLQKKYYDLNRLKSLKR